MFVGYFGGLRLGIDIVSVKNIIFWNVKYNVVEYFKVNRNIGSSLNKI